MKTQEKWIKEWHKIRDTGVDEKMSQFYNRIEKFISLILSQSLKEERSSLIKKIKKMKKKPFLQSLPKIPESGSVEELLQVNNAAQILGFNQALEIFLNLLKENI